MVAAHAGVSPMSVSNVLNGRSASLKVREAVHSAIEELGYVPNSAARQLASAAPRFIGLIHANDEHPLSSALLTGALTAASRLGVQLLLQPIIFSDIDKVRDAVATLQTRGAEGVLLPAVFGETLAGSLAENALDIAMMCAGAAKELPMMPTVRIDEFAAAREVTAGLIARGHRRIGFLRVPEEFPVHHSRGGGYIAGLRDHGLPVAPELIVKAEFWFQEGLTGSAKLLDLDDPPTAIFASNDEMAMGALATAHVRGIPVPEKLAIVGFEDNFFAQNVWPALSSVKVPMALMAERAMEMLVRQINTGTIRQGKPETMIVDHAVKWRASTGD